MAMGEELAACVRAKIIPLDIDAVVPVRVPPAWDIRPF